MADAFDANILIVAANSGPRSVAGEALAGSDDRLGSTLLLPEVLSKPLRLEKATEVTSLNAILATFDLKAVDEEVADAAVTMGAKYGLKAPDAIHLATAVLWGADRFFTLNAKDFGEQITEIDVVVPA